MVRRFSKKHVMSGPTATRRTVFAAIAWRWKSGRAFSYSTRSSTSLRSIFLIRPPSSAPGHQPWPIFFTSSAVSGFTSPSVSALRGLGGGISIFFFGSTGERSGTPR